MKKIKTGLLEKGGVYAIKVAAECWCYVRFGRGLGEYVYPFATFGGFLPMDWFKARNWRWLVTGPSELEADLKYAGRLSEQHDTWYDEFVIWENDPISGLEITRRRNVDGSLATCIYGVSASAEDILLAEPEIVKQWDTDNLIQFLQDHLSEMTVIDSSMATLLPSYEVSQSAPKEPGRIEVWIEPTVPDPKDTIFEDFIEDVLDAAEQGSVGEFADMKNYQFASCDVEDAAKAAKALLKAFKKAGYTTGIEIKEIDGKERVWKVE